MGSGDVTCSMLNMHGAKLGRHKDLHGLTDQQVLAVSKKFCCLPVRHHDLTEHVGYYLGVRSRVERGETDKFGLWQPHSTRMPGATRRFKDFFDLYGGSTDSGNTGMILPHLSGGVVNNLLRIKLMRVMKKPWLRNWRQNTSRTSDRCKRF